MLCEQIPDLEVVKAFSCPEKFLNEKRNIDFDLIITDIEMPKINGIELANLSKDKLIIFITAYKEFAVDAFDLDVVDYVCKPIQKSRLETAIKKAIAKLKHLEQSKEYISLYTDKGNTVVKQEHILLITTSTIDRRDKIMYLQNNKTIKLKNYTISDLLKILPKSTFCQINKQEIISIKAVEFFNRNHIMTKIIESNGNQINVTLSDVYRVKFKSIAMSDV